MEELDGDLDIIDEDFGSGSEKEEDFAEESQSEKKQFKKLFKNKQSDYDEELDDDEDDDDDDDENSIIKFDEEEEDIEEDEIIDPVSDEDEESLKDEHVKNTSQKDNYNQIYEKSLYSKYDYVEEGDDNDMFLNKFDSDLKQNYIISNHPECLNKNYNDVKLLTKTIRDDNNNIIDELHKSIPILTKYEKTKIIGLRIKQLNSGCKPYISVDESIIDNFLIAKLELEQKKIPFIIERPMPNNISEYWNIKDLEIL